MEQYNYEAEIYRMILHFMSAIDGAVVKRYDKDMNVVDQIQVNYLYGPKERIYRDLIDKAEHIKLPIVSVMMKSIKRDNNRVKDKIVGWYERYLEYNQDGMIRMPMPVPVNLTFDVSIMAKYQRDLTQILTNFIPHADPYFIISWKEPFTNKEIRSKVQWDEQINIDPKDELNPTDPYQRITAETSFEFQGYIFKAPEDINKICQINTDYIITNRFFCDYDDLLEYTLSAETESFSLSGRPRVEWATPHVVTTGYTVPSACEYENKTYGRTEELEIEGWFPKVTDVFLSASDPNMFTDTVSSFDIFDGDTNYPEFDGIIVQTYAKPLDNPHTITFDLPVLQTDGYLDIIVVNTCGYSKLTVDRRVRESCCVNPYPESHALHDSWDKLQDPLLSGVEVVNNALSCE